MKEWLREWVNNHEKEVYNLKGKSKSIGTILLLFLVCRFLLWCGVEMYEYQSVKYIERQKEWEEEQKEKNKITTETIYLASINYTSEIKGKGSVFYLGIGYGSGKVSEEQYYVAYRIREDGGLVLYKMLADEVVIYETLDEGEKAYVEIDSNWWGEQGMKRLYVPKGTVMQDYDLSLE